MRIGWPESDLTTRCYAPLPASPWVFCELFDLPIAGV